jgi:hypothetical protein
VEVVRAVNTNSTTLHYTHAQVQGAIAARGTHAITTLDEFDSHQFVVFSVTHEFGYSKVAGTDVPDLRGTRQQACWHDVQGAAAWGPSVRAAPLTNS